MQLWFFLVLQKGSSTDSRKRKNEGSDKFKVSPIVQAKWKQKNIVNEHCKFFKRKNEDWQQLNINQVQVSNMVFAKSI